MVVPWTADLAVTRCSDLDVQFPAPDLVWTWPWRPQSGPLGQLLDRGSLGPQWVGQGGFQEVECRSQLASLSALGGCRLEVVPTARLLSCLNGVLRVTHLSCQMPVSCSH